MYFLVCKGKNVQFNNTVFKRGDKGIVTYTHIVISYSVIVTFNWRNLKGAGVIDPNEICHGEKVSNLDIRVMITELDETVTTQQTTDQSN